MYQLIPYRAIVITSAALILITSSCTKFTEVDPPRTQLSSPTVFTNDGTATSAILGIYTDMTITTGRLFSGGTSFMTGIYVDELSYYLPNPVYQEFSNNSLTAANQEVNNLWTQAYEMIYNANSIIEGLHNNNGVSQAVKSQLEGEARFIRALAYFYLVNIYGEVPLVLTTDYRENRVAARVSIETIYQQMIQDLTDAKQLLPLEYVDASNTTSTKRIRPNRSVAMALLARTLLYSGKWVDAQNEASDLIADPRFQLETDLSLVFLPASRETIWHVIPVSPFFNTGEGFFFGQPAQIPFYGSLDTSLINTFEEDDQRKEKWVRNYVEGGITYYMPSKYKLYVSQAVLEYNVMFRLAEQYLIRAEAKLNNGDEEGARSDINVIRSRAGLEDISTIEPEALKLIIENERKNEFFVELGHRFFDLKRTNRINDVLLNKKPTWKSSSAVFPIPIKEIQNNPNLTQNTDY